MSILLAKESGEVPCWLAQADPDLVVVREGRKAVEYGKRGAFGLIILAGALSGLEAHAVCAALRAERISTPILALLDPGSESAQVQLLEAGADSVLPLATSERVQAAQVLALLRRSKVLHGPLRFADLVLDRATRRAERSGKRITLSGTEYSLLELLLRQSGQVVPRTTIMSHVWPDAPTDTDNVLDVYISYLRAKIDRGFTPPLIQTVRGQGYRIG